jgi:hypothetical protein
MYMCREPCVPGVFEPSSFKPIISTRHGPPRLHVSPLTSGVLAAARGRVVACARAGTCGGGGCRNTQEALSNRMDALDILAEAAVILSALPELTPPPPVSGLPHANAPSNLKSGGRGGGGAGGGGGGGYDIYHPSSGKTRRWSDRSKVKAAAVGVNQFGELLEVCPLAPRPHSRTFVTRRHTHTDAQSRACFAAAHRAPSRGVTRCSSPGRGASSQAGRCACARTHDRIGAVARLRLPHGFARAHGHLLNTPHATCNHGQVFFFALIPGLHDTSAAGRLLGFRPPLPTFPTCTASSPRCVPTPLAPCLSLSFHHPSFPLSAALGSMPTFTQGWILCCWAGWWPR